MGLEDESSRDALPSLRTTPFRLLALGWEAVHVQPFRRIAYHLEYEGTHQTCRSYVSARYVLTPTYTCCKRIAPGHLYFHSKSVKSVYFQLEALKTVNRNHANPSRKWSGNHREPGMQMCFCCVYLSDR